MTDPTLPATDARLARALADIDAANADDPRRIVHQGQPIAWAVFYSMRMSHWLDRLAPGASEALRLAVRCQHLRRWTIDRASYPATRVGYLQWRTTLGRFHADEAGRILAGAGYDAATIARAQSLIRKERLKSDPEAQALEDAACLVFLENEYPDFARAHEPAKVIHILRRTWKKMSDAGHGLAMELAGELPDDARALIGAALADSDAGDASHVSDRSGANDLSELPPAP